MDGTALAVVLLGVAVGVTELLTRYTDSPWDTLKSGSAMLYLALNGLAAWAALFLLRVNGFAECADTTCTLQESTWQALGAGLSGMAVLRASVLNIRVQGQDVGVGPAGIIQIYLNIADRSLDRSRAEARAGSISNLMQQVSFDKASVSLPAACFALMRNVSDDEQNIVSQQVNAIAGVDMPDSVRSVLLGLSLLDIVGEPALRAAIDLLGDEILH